MRFQNFDKSIMPLASMAVEQDDLKLASRIIIKRLLRKIQRDIYINIELPINRSILQKSSKLVPKMLIQESSRSNLGG